MKKSELRRIYLAKRSSLPPDDRVKLSGAIADRFFSECELSAVTLLHCFLSIDKFNEIDTTPVFQRLWNEFPHIETAVPRVDRATGKMLHLKFTPETELIQNVWGIREPAHENYFESEQFDVVIVPLLCFDTTGHRVGYGKGFYDRFLTECRPECRKIGLSYFEPVEEIADVGEFDVRLDAVITPDDVFKWL